MNSRARPTKDEGVRAIQDLMRLPHTDPAHWQRGRTVRELAVEWEMPRSTVRAWASLASRLIGQLLEDDADQLREDVSSALSEAMHHGIDLLVDQNDAKAGAVGVAAAATLAKIAGLEAPQRLEVSVVAQQFAALPPSAKSARLREQAAKLIAAADHIDRLEARNVIDEDQGAEGTSSAGKQLGAGEGSGGAG